MENFFNLDMQQPEPIIEPVTNNNEEQVMETTTPDNEIQNNILQEYQLNVNQNKISTPELNDTVTESKEKTQEIETTNKVKENNFTVIDENHIVIKSEAFSEWLDLLNKLLVVDIDSVAGKLRYMYENRICILVDFSKILQYDLAIGSIKEKIDLLKLLLLDSDVIHIKEVENLQLFFFNENGLTFSFYKIDKKFIQNNYISDEQYNYIEQICKEENKIASVNLSSSDLEKITKISAKFNSSKFSVLLEDDKIKIKIQTLGGQQKSMIELKNENSLQGYKHIISPGITIFENAFLYKTNALMEVYALGDDCFIKLYLSSDNYAVTLIDKVSIKTTTTT